MKQANYFQQVKKCVTFIFDTSEDKIPLGTGFFVGIIKQRKNENLTAIYLVTAKHVLQDKNGRFYDKIL